jgi:hypothetical protein
MVFLSISLRLFRITRRRSCPQRRRDQPWGEMKSVLKGLVDRLSARVSVVESSWHVVLWFGSSVAEESQYFDRSALQAVVAAAAEEFDGEILLLVRDGSKMRVGASESAGLNARVILPHCLRRLNELEEQPLDTTTRAFVRVVSEDLNNDQIVLLIVRGQGDIRLASGAGAQGKVRDMLNDALQAIGGERRRR